MRLQADMVPDVDFISEITPFFDATNEGCNLITGERYVSGYLDNYKVSISDSGISLKGSLSKFYYGEPLKLLDRVGAKKAIEKLSDCLHLPMEKANINRFDITQDIELDYRAETYYKHLGTARYYQRLTQAKSLYYSNKQRQLVFYNKIAELKAKGIDIPEDKLSKNLIRFELRFMKGVNKQLKQQVSGQTLYDESFYQSMVERWYQEFTKVKKVKPLDIGLSNIESSKEFFEYAALQHFENGYGGLVDTLEVVDQLKQMNIFSRREYYSKLKAKIKRMYDAQTKGVQCNLLEELNQKVAQAYLKAIL